MAQKRIWQEPQVKSIDQLPAVYGLVCSSGTTASGTGPKQCNVGTAAKQEDCTTGGSATSSCLNGGNGSA